MYRKYLVMFATAVAVVVVVTLLIRNRAALSQPASDKCIMNLWDIATAKRLWMLDNRKSANDVPTWDDIQPYMGPGSEGRIPNCPNGGRYTIGRLSDPPTCSIGGVNHSLPADWQQHLTNQ